MKAAAAFAIVNFVWQGAAIGALAWLGFSLARTPRVRYLVGVAAIALMALAPLVTGVVSARRSAFQGSLSTVQNSPKAEVPAASSGGEALGRDTQSFGESGTAANWSDGLNDPRIASMILALWMMGVAALSTRLAFGWVGARRLTRRVTAAGASVQIVANRLIVSLRIRATVSIVESALVKVPAVVGAFKPVVLLPAAAMSGLSMEQLEALLAHELAHVRRHDYLVNLLQSAVETLLFYHPAVWLVSRRVRQERELCCDDLALAVCGDRVAYASALANLESLRSAPSPALAANGGSSLTLAADGGSLLTRVRRILGHDEVSALAGRGQSLAGVAILASIILLAGGQAARARAVALTGPGVEIVEADGTGDRRALDAPQIQGPVVGVQGGVAGGVRGGVAGGIPGGTPGGVVGGIVGGVQGTTAIEVPVETAPQDIVPDAYIIRLGDQLNVSVSSPIPQPEFSARPITVQQDGSVMLPHFYQPLKIVGLTIAQARQAIRAALISGGQYVNPIVDVNLAGYTKSDLVEVAAEPMDDSTPSITAGQVIRLEVVVGQVRQSEFNKDYTVQPDGTILLPYIGATRAAGLTTKDLGGLIAGELNSTRTLPGAKVTASIETRQIPVPPKGISVIVQGAVRAPGSIALREDHITLPDALAGAGGFQASAGSRIWLKRRGSPDLVLMKADVLQGRSEINVQDGDMITVEAAPHFYVIGYVKSGNTEFNWEEGITLQMALARAGGVSTGGSIDRATLAGWVADARREFNRAGIETQAKKAAWDTLTGKVDLFGDPLAASQAAPAFWNDRFVMDYKQQILDKERNKKQLLEVEKLGASNPRVMSVESDLAIARAQLKARLAQIVESARQEYENAKSAEARYKDLYLNQEAQATSRSAAGALSRITIERKDPKTGKFINIKLSKDPMTTPIEPGDVIKVPAKRT